MRTTFRQALGGLLGLAIVSTATVPARASGDSIFNTLVVVAAGIVITDVVFAAHGISVAGKGELPTAGWSIAETVFTVPQTVASNIFVSTVLLKDDDDGVHAAALIPTIGVTILTTHGIWGTAVSESHAARPGVLAGSSIAVGADVALTTSILACTFAGKLSGRPVGILNMVFTAPQVAAASYLAATTPASDRAGWIGLSAWSGALFVHGLVSAIHGHGDSQSDPVEAPSPPPPDPLPTPVNTPPAPLPLVPDNRPPLMVPESLRVGPTIVTDGVATAVGIGISGVLF